jgi:succinate-semialdehyde dehydrogenase / glutarate-semialdehyde dehydrogenase
VATRAGVLNVVSGVAAEIGAELAASTAVRKLTFTGSTRVGRLLLRQAADSIKRVSLELGGNAPLLVFADADIDAAAAAVAASGLRNAGQTCICANRVLVEVRTPM